MKTCTGCKETKPLSEFHKSSIHLDGRASRCRTCRNSQNQQHYAENRERYRGVRRAWYESHREEHKARVLSKRDPVVHAEQARAWGQSPEGRLKKRENQAVRRTEKGTYRDARRMGRFFKQVLERDGMICHICGVDIPSLDDLHFDHVIPLSKGGTHTMENVKPAHALCNRKKAAR